MLIALVLVITPGPDFAVVVPAALRSRRAGYATALGTATGLAVHAAIAALGLAALMLASDLAFSLLKYIGAVFLIVLGLRILWMSRLQPGRLGRPGPVGTRPGVAGVTDVAGVDASVVADAGGAVPLARCYRRGLLVNVLNPKAPLIYLSVLPPFVRTSAAWSTTGQLLVLSTVLVILALAWYLLLSTLIGALRGFLIRFRVWIDRATGGVLIALGLRLAVQARPA